VTAEDVLEGRDDAFIPVIITVKLNRNHHLGFFPFAVIPKAKAADVIRCVTFTIDV
jgi:hypothetical protein